MAYFWGETMLDLEPRLKKYRRIKSALTRKNEQFQIIYDFLVEPLMPSLTRQEGVVHTCSLEYGYSNGGRRSWVSIKVYKNRRKLPGFWESVKRFFSPRKLCIKIEHNNHMWVCRYYKSIYILTAQQIRDQYKEALKKDFNFDFVILDD